ncbi:MAG: glycosyltransferase family A protein [Cytophagales bacterium]
MKFSIVIPTYNRGYLISKSVDSCLALNYQNYEIIIVDDGSTDDTETVVQKYLTFAQVKYFKTTNRERGAARNFGIDQSSGDYITFLDSDDIVYPNYIAAAEKFITENPETIFFHQSFEFIDENGNVLSKNIPNKSTDILKGNFLACMGVFVKADILKNERFHESRILAGSEDYELWLRLYEKYDLKLNKVIASAMICHQKRSEYNIDLTKFETRIVYLVELLSREFKNSKLPLSQVLSHIYLYQSITYIENNNFSKASKSLKNAFKTHKNIVFEYKTWVIVYYIIKNKINFAKYYSTQD